MKQFDSDLVSGNIYRSVWKLAWPVVMLQLVSGIHGFIDQVLVGHYVGYHANAGIGVAWQLFLVMVVFVASLFHGMSVLIARYSGKQDREAVSRVAFETFLAAFIVLVFVAGPVGYFMSPYLLNWTNTSAEVQKYALPYLRVLFTASTPLFLMFMVNGAFQASGDPRTPLKLGILTTVLNVILSYILITGVGPFPEMEAIGAAVATCLAPLPSVFIALSMIVRGKTIIGPPAKFHLIPDMSVIRVVARIGIPTGIQAVLLNIGGAVLLGFIGSLELSAAAQAAYTICYTQLFSFITWAGFGLRAAASTVMGQNIGAGKPERGKQGVYVAASLGFLWSIGFGLAYWTIPELLLGIFNVTDADVLTIGTRLLKFLTVSGLFMAANLALTGGIQGTGDTKKPMYIAFVTQIVILLGICTVFDRLGRLNTDAIWFSITVSHAMRFLITCIVFYRGQWAHVKVELDQ